MGGKNSYEILNVSEKATDKEIKAAYRKLAKENHPDSHPGDEECAKRFKEASEAYSILSDPDKRKSYDEELRIVRKRGEGGRKSASGGRAAPNMGNVDFQNMNRSFESFFGFDPDTKDIVNEDKLKPKAPNPLDATDLFEKYMRMKR